MSAIETAYGRIPSAGILEITPIKSEGMTKETWDLMNKRQFEKVLSFLAEGGEESDSMPFSQRPLGEKVTHVLKAAFNPVLG